ncbi:MAG TPA: hypothetical protein VEC57_04755 [Candidatus Limnocylindrales bacterium]|nr:hypothetical protein [Candidatus Limnocylindrales bacterium]
MKKPILGVVGAMALIAATAAPGVAAVNCGLIKKDLDMGRKVEDIAERMAVSVDEVKKCQQQQGGAVGGQAGGHAPGTPENRPVTAPASGGAAPKGR